MGKNTGTSIKKMKISVNVLFFIIQRRNKLIDLVLKQNITVVKASKKLELKVCTARSIIAKYVKEGVVYEKNMKTKPKSKKVIKKKNLNMEVVEGDIRPVI